LDSDRWNFVHTKNAYCQDTNKSFYIENSHDVGTPSSPSRFMRLFVRRCMNNSEPGVICKSPAQQDAIIKGTYLSIKFKDSYIDPLNYVNPEIKFWPGQHMYLDTLLNKNIVFTLSKTYLITDSGFFLQSESSQVIYQFESYTESNTMSNNKDFMQVDFKINTTVYYMYRRYLK
jgi:hypothetical protein